MTDRDVTYCTMTGVPTCEELSGLVVKFFLEHLK
jgi:hypothetical protein